MPLPREIRRKLSELGRPKKPAPEAATPAGPAPEEQPARAVPPDQKPAEPGSAALGRVSRRLLKDRLQQRFLDQPSEEPRGSCGPARTLAEVLPGEEIENECGLLYVARVRAADVGATPELGQQVINALRRDDLSRAHPEFRPLQGADPSRVVILDTETTGLTGVPMFLCGVMSCGAEGLVIEQMLARDYTEEPALLRRVRDVLEAAQVLVTYNGRTFDLPYIQDRMAYHLMGYRYLGAHLDLLPHARRLYRLMFPDCKLQTLEVHLCGFPERADDIAGDQIPQAYHDFVATSNASILAPVVRHNAQDLVALCHVLLRVIGESGR